MTLVQVVAGKHRVVRRPQRLGELGLALEADSKRVGAELGEGEHLSGDIEHRCLGAERKRLLDRAQWSSPWYASLATASERGTPCPGSRTPVRLRLLSRVTVRFRVGLRRSVRDEGRLGVRRLCAAAARASRSFVDPAEWDYWIAGKPATKDLPAVFGEATIRKGAVRDGGAFARRACRFACWNSVFR